MILRFMSIFVDCILIETGDYLSLALRFGGNIPEIELVQFKQIVLFAVAIRIAVLYALGVYHTNWGYATWEDFIKIFRAVLLGSVLLVTVSFFQNVRAYSRAVYLLSFIFSLLAITGWRIVLMLIRISLWKSSKSLRKTLVIGSDMGNGSIYRFIQDERNKGYDPYFISGMLGSDELIKEVRNLYMEHKIELAFIEVEVLNVDDLMLVLKEFTRLSVRCYMAPGRYEQVVRAGHIMQIGVEPFIEVNLPGRDESVFAFKNMVEKIIAAILFILLLPLTITIYFLISKKDRMNPIYRQKRVGKDGVLFYIYKFRTMHASHENDSESDFVMDFHDTRVTSIGRWLRRTSLDELPQLINIIKGEMSFVGPRPEILQVVDRYSEWQRQVLAVKPGITGLAQVSGRKDLTIPAKLSLDLYYIQNYSFWLDIKIIFKTLFIIFYREGSY